MAGSAYTYAYVTLGEFVAWIIGWDLILEYAVGNAAVAVSWADYFKSSSPGWAAPARLAVDHGGPRAAEALRQPAGGPHHRAVSPSLLVIGIQESARANTAMVALKWRWWWASSWSCSTASPPLDAVAPIGLNGIRRRLVIFFAYIGFDAVSTTAEEAHNPNSATSRGG